MFKKLLLFSFIIASLLFNSSNAMLCNGMRIKPNSTITRNEDSLSITYTAEGDSDEIICCDKYKALAEISCSIILPQKQSLPSPQNLAALYKELDKEASIRMFQRLSLLHKQQIFNAQQKSQESKPK